MLLIPNFLPSIKPGIPECELVLPTFKVGLHSSFKHVWKPSCRHIQKGVTMMILSPIGLAVKINHNRRALWMKWVMLIPEAPITLYKMT